MTEQQTQQSVSQRQRQKQRQQSGEPEWLRSRGGRRDRRRTTTSRTFPALHLMMIILLSSTMLRMGYCFTISQTKNKPFSPANTGKQSSAPPSEMPSTTSSSKSRKKGTVRLFASKSSSSSSSTLPDIDGMKAGEMKKELESYGISTKSFFEKREFEEALKKARAEGKKPIDNKKTSSASSTSGNTSSKSKSASSSSKSSSSSTEKEGASRAERMKEEIEKANKMKVSELRKELKSRGIPTKSFFEKSEFVKAYAEAVVDNIGAKNVKQEEEEEYDASYRDVVMQKIDRASQARLLQGSPVIDIMLSK